MGSAAPLLAAGAAVLAVSAIALRWEAVPAELLRRRAAGAGDGAAGALARSPSGRRVGRSFLGTARRTRARRRQAERELPVFLDLVAVAVAAGLTGLLAVRRASEATAGPLAEELAAAMRRVDLGGRWRDELGAVAERLGLVDLRRAVLLLERHHAVGSEVSEALAELAREVRQAAGATAAERARTAPVKMLFPLVFMVLPAFLLLTVAPVLVATLRSIR
jgi:tight adherence protein C